MRTLSSGCWRTNSASMRAAIKPAGPAPTMRTSQWLCHISFNPTNYVVPRSPCGSWCIDPCECWESRKHPCQGVRPPLSYTQALWAPVETARSRLDSPKARARGRKPVPSMYGGLDPNTSRNVETRNGCGVPVGCSDVPADPTNRKYPSARRQSIAVLAEVRRTASPLGASVRST
jgi:hypothetical protein